MRAKRDVCVHQSSCGASFLSFFTPMPSLPPPPSSPVPLASFSARARARPASRPLDSRVRRGRFCDSSEPVFENASKSLDVWAHKASNAHVTLARHAARRRSEGPPPREQERRGGGGRTERRGAAGGRPEAKGQRGDLGGARERCREGAGGGAGEVPRWRFGQVLALYRPPRPASPTGRSVPFDPFLSPRAFRMRRDRME